MEEDNCEAHRLPAAVQPPQVERNLFGQIPRPRNQELREGEVCVEHHERQQELAPVVEVQRLVGVVHRLVVAEEGRHRDDEGERRESPA